MSETTNYTSVITERNHSGGGKMLFILLLLALGGGLGFYYQTLQEAEVTEAPIEVSSDWEEVAEIDETVPPTMTAAETPAAVPQEPEQTTEEMYQSIQRSLSIINSLDGAEGAEVADPDIKRKGSAAAPASAEDPILPRAAEQGVSPDASQEATGLRTNNFSTLEKRRPATEVP